jgi:hypothetical protein
VNPRTDKQDAASTKLNALALLETWAKLLMESDDAILNELNTEYAPVKFTFPYTDRPLCILIAVRTEIEEPELP